MTEQTGGPVVTAPQCGICGAFIPRPPNDGTTWRCSNCQTEFDLPTAVVETCVDCEGTGVIWRPLQLARQQRDEAEGWYEPPVAPALE